MPLISLIAAVAKNRVIGKDNALLWHFPEDMLHFRETTRGKPVVMGRKTWESLPDAFRPLPGRRNVVVTRSPDYAAPGGIVADSIEAALRAAEATPVAEEIFVIGGSELYRQTLPIADRLYLTEIGRDYEGDARFPEVPAAEWAEHSRKTVSTQSGEALNFVEYRRIR